ncbi:GumC family protein [Pedobacter sp. PWIIR3]
MSNTKINIEINYLKVVQIILSRWYWLICAVVIGVGSCFVYLKLIPFRYCSTSTLKFEEKKSEIAELISAKNFYERSNKVESEKNIIFSNRIISAAIDQLNYNIEFFIQTHFKDENIYPVTPIKIQIVKRTAAPIPDHLFRFKRVDNRTFLLSLEIGRHVIERRFKYGHHISWRGVTFMVVNEREQITIDPVVFKLIDRNELIKKISSNLKSDDSQNTNTLTIKFTSSNAIFCRDFLNALMSSYINFDRHQRQASLTQTSKFISKMLLDMDTKATKSSNTIQQFNRTNNLYDFNAQQVQSLSKMEVLKDRQNELEIQRQLIKYNLEKIELKGETNKLTFDLRGLTDPQLVNLITKYQQLILSRNERLNLYTPTSDYIVSQNTQIENILYGIQNSLKEYMATNEKNSSIVSVLLDSLHKKLQSISDIETESLNLQSSYEVDQKIYKYLSEKRLEALVAKAAVVPGAMVLDQASDPSELVSPLPLKTYSLFIILSMAGGIAIILLLNSNNPFIYDQSDLELNSSLPILGTIRKFKGSLSEKNNYLALQNSPRSIFAESIRFLRSNLSLHYDQGLKTICITSETSREGKSFIALNLAYAFTLVQKKVVIVNADLRKISQSFPDLCNDVDGLSSYLTGHIHLDSITKPSAIANLDVIPSGPIPPNPSELIASNKTKDLILFLKSRYDIVIIDSAPAGLVTDVSPIMKLADVNLFVLRSGVSKYQYLKTADRIRNDLQITSMAIILNDFEPDNFKQRYYSQDKSYPSYPSSYYYSEQLKQIPKA